MTPPRAPSSVSGNMLIYILGAIFLFGMLIVLLKGSFQEGTGVDSDKVTLQVNEVKRYAAELERGVNYILGSGQSENALRFAHPNSHVNYGVITTTPKAQVFAPEGGGVEYKNPPSGVNDGTQWQFYANTHIKDIGTDTPAASRAELLAVLPSVTRQFCEQMNLSLKQSIDLSQNADPSANGCVFGGTIFTGSFGSGSTNNTIDETRFTTLPPKEACVRCGSDSKYHYYRVLLAR